MLPTFPQFKPLELADQADIEKFTINYPPYSDYNFTSMWCWNTANGIRLSTLNNNLVVKFADYITGKNFYSFLGINDRDATLNTLFEHIDATKPHLRYLKLVPEVTLGDYTSRAVKIYPDRDNFDYVYSVEKLETLAGGKLAAKRNYVKRFKAYYQSTLIELDLKQEKTMEQIRELFFIWVMRHDRPLAEFQHEFVALNRFLKLDDYSNFLSLGIFIDGALCAFWLLEIVDQIYAMSHFQKARTADFIGINAYLLQEGALILAERGIQLINYEQDLGLAGLREAKLDFAPVDYLKKFIIERL